MSFRSDSLQSETGHMNEMSNYWCNNSMFSLSDAPSTPCPSWTSSHTSIYNATSELAPPAHYHHSYSRSSSITNSISASYTQNATSQVRLTLPGEFVVMFMNKKLLCNNGIIYFLDLVEKVLFYSVQNV